MRHHRMDISIHALMVILHLIAWNPWQSGDFHGQQCQHYHGNRNEVAGKSTVVEMFDTVSSKR
jgi:hypothetical protein